MSNDIFNKSDSPPQQTQNPVTPRYVEVPSDIVPLPSQGLVYPIGHPLSNEETIDLKPMSAVEENILTSKPLIKKGTVLTELLNACILNKTIDSNLMLAGDRNACLMAIRVSGYGSDYAVKITCPHCEYKFEHVFNMSGLKIKSLGAAPISPNVNEFVFELPISKKKVTFKLLNGYDEAEMGKFIEGKKKLNPDVETNVTSRLYASVLSIDGEREKDKLLKLIESMRAGDARALRKYMNDIEPNVDMRQSFVCPNRDCFQKSEVDVPIGTSFFWPDLS